jgi:hypothetical protein
MCYRGSKNLLLPALVLAFPLLRISAQVPPDAGWSPVTDEELHMKTPAVDKDAGIEALFWQVHVLDEHPGTQDIQRVLYHYVRLKIFNEKGKEEAATIEIPFGAHTTIPYVFGRTIKPDGTIVELKKDAIFERDVVRSSGSKRKVKAFAMPGVEPGAIVEYRWKEVQFNAPMMYIRLQMQREYPIRRVTYYLKPLPWDESAGYSMSVNSFNCRTSPPQIEKDGYSSISLENVPAFHEEPMMPGEGDVRAWVLAFYHKDAKRDPDKYWNEVGRRAYSNLKGALRQNNDIKAAAEKAVAGAANDEAKALALILYLRSNLRGLYDRSVSDTERLALIKQMPKDRVRTSAEVFKSGIGTADELNVLFAAMCSSVGLEARPVLISNRDDTVFNPKRADEYFLPNVDMAVKLNDHWHLFDVSTRLLPPQMVGWREEGIQALLSDPKTPVFIPSPLSPPEASDSHRTATLALGEDGVLEGDVQETYTGHTAEDRRRELVGDEPAKQAEDLKARVNKIFPQAEVSQCALDGVDASDKPLVLRYHISIPNYAQRTGKRILFQPLFFERGETPLFTASDRHYVIVFPYAWQEDDHVRIKLPEGFHLDNAENPGNLSFGEAGGYTLHLAVTQPGNELVADRTFVFGRNGIITFPVSAYPQLKEAFETIHSRDEFMFSLVAAPAAGAQ